MEVSWTSRRENSLKSLIIDSIIFKQMKRKSKFPRKKAVEHSPRYSSPKLHSNFKIQFNITNENLSCFMGEKKKRKKGCSKSSHTVEKRKHNEQRIKQTKVGKRSETRQKIEQRKIETSPDIARELSNKILSHIEKKGLKCDWSDGEDKQAKQLLHDTDNERLWTVFSNYQINKSFASTADFQYHQFYHHDTSKLIKQRSVYDSNMYTIVAENIGNDSRTTIMIRNIPNKYTVDDLSREIDEQHSNTYDFLYLPCDLKNQCNVGYGFINFTNTENLKQFYFQFQNHSWKKFKSEKICALTYARLQGLAELIEHFENSKVLKDRKYRPLIKYEKIQEVVMAQQARGKNF